MTCTPSRYCPAGGWWNGRCPGSPATEDRPRLRAPARPPRDLRLLGHDHRHDPPPRPHLESRPRPTAGHLGSQAGTKVSALHNCQKPLLAGGSGPPMSMELDHSFTVPVPPEQAWDVLLDVEKVAPCMPGAQVDTVDGDDVAGRLKVKVGPVSLTYKGTASFKDRDESDRSVLVEASGKEMRGAGTASATVRAALRPENGSSPASATVVTLHTTLSVTGRPAQFGRGVITEVGSRLIDKFADNLAQQLGSGAETVPAPEGGAAASASAAAPAPPTGEAAAPPAPARPRPPALGLGLGLGPSFRRRLHLLPHLAGLRRRSPPRPPPAPHPPHRPPPAPAVSTRTPRPQPASSGASTPPTSTGAPAPPPPASGATSTAAPGLQRRFHFSGLPQRTRPSRLRRRVGPFGLSVLGGACQPRRGSRLRRDSPRRRHGRPRHGIGGTFCGVGQRPGSVPGGARAAGTGAAPG